MDGDLLGVGLPPSDNTAANHTNHAGTGAEPSLLDFAAPPPAPRGNGGGSGVDLFQSLPVPVPVQAAPLDDLLGFGAPTTATTTTTAAPPANAAAEGPLVDLFGGTVPAPPAAMDPFGAQVPAATAASGRDSFAPVAAAAAGDPMADLFGGPPPARPQSQAPPLAIPDPVSAGSTGAVADEDPGGSGEESPPLPATDSAATETKPPPASDETAPGGTPPTPLLPIDGSGATPEAPPSCQEDVPAAPVAEGDGATPGEEEKKEQELPPASLSVPEQGSNSGTSAAAAEPAAPSPGGGEPENEGEKPSGAAEETALLPETTVENTDSSTAPTTAATPSGVAEETSLSPGISAETTPGGAAKEAAHPPENTVETTDSLAAPTTDATPSGAAEETVLSPENTVETTPSGAAEEAAHSPETTVETTDSLAAPTTDASPENISPSESGDVPIETDQQAASSNQQGEEPVSNDEKHPVASPLESTDETTPPADDAASESTDGSGMEDISLEMDQQAASEEPAANEDQNPVALPAGTNEEAAESVIAPTGDAKPTEAKTQPPPAAASSPGTLGDGKGQTAAGTKPGPTPPAPLASAASRAGGETGNPMNSPKIANRFASLKNMAGSIQLPQKKAGAANRFASFKSMAGKVGAKAKAELAKGKAELAPKVSQQLAGVQLSKRLANVADWAEGNTNPGRPNRNAVPSKDAAHPPRSAPPSAVPKPQPQTDAKTPPAPVVAELPAESTANLSSTISQTGILRGDSEGSVPTPSARQAGVLGASNADAQKAIASSNTTAFAAPELSKTGQASLPSQEEHPSPLNTPHEPNEDAKDTSDSNEVVLTDSTQSVPSPFVEEECLAQSSSSAVDTDDALKTEKSFMSSEGSGDNDTLSSPTSNEPMKSPPVSDQSSSKDDGNPSSSEIEIQKETNGKNGATETHPAGSIPSQSTPPSDQIEVLQKELHAAHTLIMQLQHHENVEEERPGDAVMVELQASLQKEMNRRAEAEEKARVAMAQSQRIGEEYKLFKIESKANLDDLTNKLETLTQEKDAFEKELIDIREERDEQARKEMALTTRLNAAKKKEAVKANAAEHYEEQVDQLESSVKDYKTQVESLSAERTQLQEELEEWKQYAEKRTEQLENNLKDEKKLNDERKRKMKAFVEAKTEEVRLAKTDYLSLQTEMDQNTHSLKELNQRYKQLHAQWVQSQTRNRELQRDAMKMKKDSEKMHKVGDSLEARLSRSAQQSEDHKNKRIHARNELMSVLGQLEAERAVNSRLQESIKLTLTPKALSQQQTIREALDEFEGALQKLSVRIGRPLPPPMSNSAPGGFSDVQSTDDGSIGRNPTSGGTADGEEGSTPSGAVSLSEVNTNRAIQQLENETQRVSQNIMDFSAGIERMNNLLNGPGTRNCVDVLSQLLSINGTPPPIGEPSRRGVTRGGQRYGQI